jgi:hypothetical protein
MVTYSQYNQDLLVLGILKFKKNGYFLDIGSSHPIKFSNTYLLEKSYGWNGLCVDPIDHSELYKKERSCNFECAAIYTNSGYVEFMEQNNPVDGYSMLSSIKHPDVHPTFHNPADTKLVKCLSFKDLFNKYNIPNKIDYMSLDTEGSEFLILNTFPFSSYSVSIITFEHIPDVRKDIIKTKKIKDLLSSNGYKAYGKCVNDYVFINF